MVLETPRLLLREFESSDWRAVYAYQNDPRYPRFYEWEQRTEADVRDFVSMFLASQVNSPRRNYQLAVVLKDGGSLIGNCGVRVSAPAHREGNMGYEIDPHFWGNGYATEAGGAVLRFGFQELGLHRIWAQVVAENAPSIRVLKKLGMRQEGRLREKEFIKGRWHDQLIFAVLESEWEP